MSEKIKPDEISFEELMSNIRSGLIKIPDFQREFVWTRQQIVELLDSIYHHYPIGSFLFWITKEKLNAQRNIGNITLPEADENSSVNYVLDGQQRITSLFASLENAEIKINENGKTKSKKLQIFFDLDNEEFMFNAGKEDEEATGKIRSWWPLPGGVGSYADTLIEILAAVQSSNLNNKTLSDWIKDNYKNVKSNKSITGYVDIIRRGGFIKLENDLYRLTEVGKEVLDKRDKKLILEVLINNVEFFDDLLKLLLANGKTTAKVAHELLEKKYDIGWTTEAQIGWRLQWLFSLGYVGFENKNYSLTEAGSRIASALELEGEEGGNEEDIRFIPVKKLIGHKNLIEIIPRLRSDKRIKSFEKVLTALTDYKFSVIYVKDQPLDVVCRIFERINNSGTVLNVVDLMTAKTWSADFNLREKLFDFEKQLKNYSYESLPDITILQCISSHILRFCTRKDILSLAREQIEENWDKSVESIKKSIDYLYKLNICTATILPFNAMIIPLSYFYFKTNCVDENSDQAKVINQWFWRAAASNRYDSALESKIAEDIKKFDGLLSHESVSFDYQFSIISAGKIKDQNYKLRNAFCKTILCLFATKKPLNFKNNSQINLKESFSKYSSKEFHHLFPRNYLKRTKDDLEDFSDSIANIAFAPASLNKEMLDKAPSNYLEKLGNEKIGQSLKTHLIPDLERSGLFEDNFSKLLDYRSAQILTELENLTGMNLEAIGEDHMLKPDTTFSNQKYLWEAIRKCNEYICWFDPYFTKNGLVALIEEVDPAKIKEIRILSGLKQTNEILRNLYKKFKEELEGKGVKVSFRIITDNFVSNIHDRWIISSGICFNVPSINTIDRGQFSEIKITENRPPFEDWWEKGRDFIDEWSEIINKNGKNQN